MINKLGLDLTLVFNRYDKHFEWFLAYDKLKFHRDYDLFDEITKFEGYAHPLPPGTIFEWYGDDGIYKTKEDPYGDELKYILAKDLSKIEDPKDLNAWNKAIMVFVRTLPPEIMIVLYWH